MGQILYAATHWKIRSPRKFIMLKVFAQFPDINFGNDDNDYSGDPANKSLQSSY